MTKDHTSRVVDVTGRDYDDCAACFRGDGAAGRALAPFMEGLANAVDALGSNDFPHAMDDAIRALIPFDNSMLFAYAPGQRPIGVYSDLASRSEASIIIDKYVAGPYLLDPFFDEVCRGRKDSMAHLAKVAPDEFKQTEYFERHYRRTGISDEIGFFMGLAGGVTAVLSITRRGGDEIFDPAEVELLHAIAGPVCALGRRHWADLRQRFQNLAGAPAGEAARGPIEETLLSLKRETLSDRQAEIISFLLKGHSTQSIALHLDISVETVKVHRRNAYAKLGISSQAELFSIFLEQLSSMIWERR